jgi:hypothetical protein
MINIISITNRTKDIINITIEPWASEYNLQSDSYVSVVVDNTPSSQDITLHDDGSVQIFLTGCQLNEKLTQVHLRYYEE